MRGWVGALVAVPLGWGLACGIAGVFECEASADCGTGGTCESTGFCSFPDGECESGHRYGSLAGDGLAGECVEPNGTTSSSTVTTDPETGSSIGTSSTSTDTSSSTLPITNTDATTSPATSEGQTSTSSSSTGEPIPDGLVLWLRFDEEADGTVIDSGPNGLDGTCDLCPQLGPGVDGEAGVFDGTNLGASFGDNDALRPAVFTIAAWARVDAFTSQYGHIVGKAVGTATRNTYELFFANLAGDNPAVEFTAGNSATSGNVDSPVVLGQWYHFAGVLDGTDMILYVDGIEAMRRVAPTLEYDDNPVVLGIDVNGGIEQNFLDGVIDDVRIYDVALDPTAIADLATPPR